MNYHQYFKIYKPYGYLSQFINNGPKQGKKSFWEIYIIFRRT